MPITVHPVDGLISRLLQQYHRTSGGGQSSSRPAAHPKSDNVHISSQARDMAAETKPDADKLESSLLGLYSYRGNA